MDTDVDFGIDYNKDERYKDKFPLVFFMESKEVKLVRYSSVADLRNLVDKGERLLKAFPGEDLE